MSPHRLRVTCVRIPTAGPVGELDAFERLLTAGELTRSERFVFDRDRNQFVVGRALARTLLAEATLRPPAPFPFVLNAYGCPELEASFGAPGLHFNIAHTPGMVLCGVARDVAFGVDVEQVRELDDLLALADLSFSPAEIADVRSTPPAARARRFFDYWTLKEAYIKARRMGVSLPLAKFGFALGPSGVGAPAAPRIAFDPAIHDDADAWTFAQRTPAASFLVATAVRAPDADLELVEVTTSELASRAAGATGAAR